MEGEDRSKTGDEKQPSTSVTMSQIGHEFWIIILLWMYSVHE